jgi:hypothetical protein
VVAHVCNLPVISANWKMDKRGSQLEASLGKIRKILSQKTIEKSKGLGCDSSGSSLT